MAFRNRGAVWYDKKEYDKAIADYNESIHLRPNDPTAYNNLGKTLKEQGKLQDAIAAYRAAIRLKPDYAHAHANLRRRPSRPGEAGRGGCRVPYGGPGSSPTAPMITSAAQGKLEELIAEYRAAIRVKPEHASAHYSLGVALEAQGKLEEAIAGMAHGDPAQTRLPVGSLQPRSCVGRPRKTGGSHRRVAHKQSGSNPTTQRLITTSASLCRPSGSSRRRSPNIARRSGSSPIMPSPTTNSAPPCTPSGS